MGQKTLYVKGVFLVIIRCVAVEGMLGEIIFVGQKRADAAKLQDALAAIQHGKLIHAHQLFATMSSDELKKLSKNPLFDSNLYYWRKINIIDMMRLHYLNCTPLYCWLRKILIKSDAIHWDFSKGYWYAIKELFCVRGGNWMTEKVLVVDDERDIADLLEVYLRNENYDVYKYYSAREALECIENQEMDLAILDIMMPDINGFSLCQKIREKYTYPIIMLTAKDEETDKITGLTLGADDYVTKPFRPLELIARVKAQLRRYKKYTPAQIEKHSTPKLTYKKLMLDTQTYECELNGTPISLTPTEFSILRILLERQGTVVTLEDLFHLVWKDEYYSKNSSTITVHVRHLREKLQDTAEKPQYIKTIWGVGYKI